MTTQIKKATTAYPVLDMIKERWSPRAFANRAVSEADVKTILEAGSWAASSSNEQPWKYVFAMKGTPGFERLFSCLDDGNQQWAGRAAVLMVAIARKTFAKNGRPNPHAGHDLGMSNATMFLQAVSMGIYPHPMAGFYAEKVKEALELTEDEKPVCMIAWGYPGDPETLDEKNKASELSPRSRKNISEFAKQI